MHACKHAEPAAAARDHCPDLQINYCQLARPAVIVFRLRPTPQLL